MKRMNANVRSSGELIDEQSDGMEQPAAKKLRMLIVASDTYPPFRVDLTVLFGDELARRGYQIDLLLQSEGPCPAAYATEWSGGKVWVGPTDLGASLLNRLRKHLRGIVHDWSLFKHLRSGEYDLIEVKDKFVSGLFAMVAARRARKPFVFWLSYPFPEHYLLHARDGSARYPFLWWIRGHVFRVLLYKMLLRVADHVFVQSEQMKRDIAREGIPLHRMTAVPMGFKPEDFIATDRSSDRVIPADSPSFLYLGTLLKVRRLDFLVRVLAQLRQRITDVKLYVVGSGDDPSDEQLLIDEARRLGVSDALVMVGQLPREQAMRFVRDATVCVSPFYPTPILKSTSPTKLVEYMAMGKAVVANDHPEQQLVIEQSKAGYCVPWDEAAFADALFKLIKDPVTAQSMGERGRRYVLEQRSYQRIANDVESMLLQIAAGGAVK